MRKSRNIAITLPATLYDKIESVRGDVSRSRFIYRLVEKSLNQSQEGVLSAPSSTRQAHPAREENQADE